MKLGKFAAIAVLLGTFYADAAIVIQWSDGGTPAISAGKGQNTVLSIPEMKIWLCLRLLLSGKGELRMIRTLRKTDVEKIGEIWLDTNLSTHDFIPAEYWQGNFTAVKEMFPQAEVYVFQDEERGEIQGFIGLNEEHIEGIFVRTQAQGQGIGRNLLDFVKSRKERLSLNVYQKNSGAVRFYQREGFRIADGGTDENTGAKDYLMVWEASASE